MAKQSMLDGDTVAAKSRQEPVAEETKLSYSELLAQHKQLQIELKRRDEEAAQVANQAGGQPVRGVPRVDQSGPQYRFKIRGAGKSAAHLPEKTITCGDESEAKRIYCLETEDTAEDKHGRAVNPSEYRFEIVNLDEHIRQDAIRNKYRFSELRRKYNLGVTLSKEETQELSTLDTQFGAEARRVAAATGKAWNPSPQPVAVA